jgi:hypothetical protein
MDFLCGSPASTAAGDASTTFLAATGAATFVLTLPRGAPVFTTAGEALSILGTAPGGHHPRPALCEELSSVRLNHLLSRPGASPLS